jgi:site-specific recombinase XerD
MASIQKFSPIKGYRIHWRLFLPDGTNKEKFKASKSKSILQEVLPDIMQIESLSRRRELTRENLLRAVNIGIVTREEAALFSLSVGGDPIPHQLEELRMDFETQSRTRSASHHCHMANLSKANILEEYFKETPVQKITPEVIEQYRSHRKKTVTNTTVNHDLKILRKYLDIAVSKGMIMENPARKVALLGEPKNRIPRCLYPEELKLFFGGLQERKHLLRGEIFFVVKFLMLTGLRRSELCNLKTDNIRLGVRQIHLVGKGRKARIVGIHHALIEDLKKRIAKGYILDPSINPSSITHAFKKIVRAVGLPDNITLHSLRHTYVSYLLERGVDPATVREHAGHFSLSMTDNYAHALPSLTVPEDAIDIEGLE